MIRAIVRELRLAWHDRDRVAGLARIAGLGLYAALVAGAVAFVATKVLS